LPSQHRRIPDGSALGSLDGGHDFAVGGFKGTANNEVGFSAHSDPAGGNPRGHLSQNIPQVRKDRFTVTCLAVIGNHAALELTPSADRVAVVHDEP
jgi:hypothetical protein